MRARVVGNRVLFWPSVSLGCLLVLPHGDRCQPAVTERPPFKGEVGVRAVWGLCSHLERFHRQRRETEVRLQALTVERSSRRPWWNQWDRRRTRREGCSRCGQNPVSRAGWSNQFCCKFLRSWVRGEHSILWVYQYGGFFQVVILFFKEVIESTNELTSSVSCRELSSLSPFSTASLRARCSLFVLEYWGLSLLLDYHM